MQTDHSLLLQDNDTIDSVSELVGVNTTDLETCNPEVSSGSLPGTGSAICIMFPMGNYTLIPIAPPINVYPNVTAAWA